MIGNILRYRYELIEKIGDGFLFSVFKARDRVQNRIVAIKLLRTPFNENEQLSEALRQAAFVTAKLSSPTIARVYEMDEHEGVPFLITELARGANLKERIRRVAPLSVPVAIDSAIAIAEAVDAAHRSGIVHADLCPQNVIVGMEGNVKVTDFGLAPVYVTSQEVKSMYWGRAASYLPPEVSRGDAPSVTTDVYSLGIILWEMLSGELPFTGETPFAIAMKHEKQPIPSLRVVNPAVPLTVDEIVMKATQKKPSDRYQMMSELLYDLKTVRDALRFGKPLTWSPSDESTRPAAAVPVATTVPIADPSMFAESVSASTTPASVPEQPSSQPFTPQPEQPIQETSAPAPLPEGPVVARGSGNAPKEKRPLIAAPKPPAAPPMPEVVYEDAGVPFWLKALFVVTSLIVLGAMFLFAGVLFFNWTSPRDVTVPQLVGKSRDEAKTQLEGLGLKMEVERSEYNDKYAPLTVYYVTPGENKTIKVNSKVKVWLSLGPKTVRVPDLRNKTQQEAAQILAAVDLIPAAEVRQVASANVTFGSIVSQNPSPGAKVDRGKVVQLSVSSGPPEITSPDADVNRAAERMRTFDVSVTLPGGENDIEVRIDVEDAQGSRTYWSDKRPPGDKLTQQVTAVGDSVTIRVFADNKKVKEITYGAN